MKNILLVFLIAGVLSCKKDNEVKASKEDIIGTWELERFVGYPFNQPLLPQGNGNIIMLGEDGLFERKRHNILIFRGSYSLTRKKDCHERNTDRVLSTSESSSGDYQYIEIEGGKLLLSIPNCLVDGGTAYYRRIEQ